MIRILIIEHSLPFYHVPLWELLSSIPDVEITVAYGSGFFTGDNGGVPEGSIPSNTKVLYEKSPIVHEIFGIKYLWNTISISKLLKIKYDIVIHQSELKVISLFVSLFISKIKRVPFCLWGIGNPLKSSRYLDILRKFISRISDGYIFYSASSKQKYINWGIDSEKLFVAQNSIDVDRIISLSNSYSKNNAVSSNLIQINVYQILFVGRIVKRKRLDVLLDSLKILISKGIKIKLVIIGEGDELESLINQAKKLHIEKEVDFLGRINGYENLTPWFLNSHLIVCPAQVGHLATEAHAYGVPIIISDDKSVMGPEAEIVIEDVTGYKYKHLDTESLSQKIIEAIGKIKQNDDFIKTTRKRAIEFAGVRKMASGFIDAVNKLTNSNIKLL